uniref:Leucine-rich repeat extensin-like protein 4 n=1 Tax=Ananas comosus var. bracteatus TaxID=296719 RepID=A0A6V7QJ44_ANACO|nr:unnamed protein product [Ananas comosus var. bracteatus]
MRYMRQLSTHQTTTFSSIPLTQRSEPKSSKGIFEKAAPLLIDLIPKMMQGIGFFLLLFSSLHLSSPSALAYIGNPLKNPPTSPQRRRGHRSERGEPRGLLGKRALPPHPPQLHPPQLQQVPRNGPGELQRSAVLDGAGPEQQPPRRALPRADPPHPGLIYLDLRFNSFSGELPEALFQKQLDAIFLNNNQFEGQIPASLWASPASVITLANNNLTGPIPASFGYSSGIRELLFLNNRLTGCIPEGVGFLAEVEVLDLSFNSLGGDIPSTLSCLSGIEVLNVAHNGLTGELPDILCELRSLANLSVSFNFFSGFGADCTRELLIRNVGFDFAGNCIPGRGMQRPPPECPGSGPGAGLSCLRTRPAGCGGSGLRVGVGIPGIPFTLSTTLPIPVP